MSYYREVDLRRGWLEGKRAIVAGSSIYLLFIQIEWRTDFPFELPAFFAAWAGIALLFGNLRRSNWEFGIRALLAANLAHIALTCLTSRFLGQLPITRVAILGLVVGLIGSLVPTAMRRRAYGFLLAFLWALLLGTGADEFRATGAKILVAVIPAGLVLAGITAVYTRWSQTGRFPKPIEELFRLLPEDDSPLKSLLKAKPAVAETLVGIPRKGEGLDEIQGQPVSLER